jgi:hypothetical protein
VAAARKLPPAQKAALVQTLQTPPASSPTRQELIAEKEALRAAGAFEHVKSLRNKCANPALNELSDEELRATIYEAATEWEDEKLRRLRAAQIDSAVNQEPSPRRADWYDDDGR